VKLILPISISRKKIILFFRPTLILLKIQKVTVAGVAGERAAPVALIRPHTNHR